MNFEHIYKRNITAVIFNCLDKLTRFLLMCRNVILVDRALTV